MSYIEENKNSYDKVYEKGWGNKYPDSNIVSYYFNYIKPMLSEISGKRKIKMLDFGCSLGANTKFFYEQNFDVYGIDISEVAITECVKSNGFIKNHFKALNILENKDLKSIFNTKFDLIVASAVLYYFSKNDVKKLLMMFNDALEDNGIIYANWGTYNDDAYRKFKDIKKRGEMIKVESTGSMDEKLNVCLVEDKHEMEEIFDIFDLRYIKSTNIELEGDNEYIHYIGTKKRV